jgi:hypothetical protein
MGSTLNIMKHFSRKMEGKMTDQEINKRIAEECGWRQVSVFEWKDGVRLPKQFHESGSGLPNYCNDLNAMHEAEKFLWTTNNWSACSYGEGLNKVTTSWSWHATARQRAEAFLRTVGKWEEGKGTTMSAPRNTDYEAWKRQGSKLPYEGEVWIARRPTEDDTFPNKYVSRRQDGQGMAVVNSSDELEAHAKIHNVSLKWLERAPIESEAALNTEREITKAQESILSRLCAENEALRKSLEIRDRVLSTSDEHWIDAVKTVKHLWESGHFPGISGLCEKLLELHNQCSWILRSFTPEKLPKVGDMLVWEDECGGYDCGKWKSHWNVHTLNHVRRFKIIERAG